jgi:phosphate-selective porin OprO/OprP
MHQLFRVFSGTVLLVVGLCAPSSAQARIDWDPRPSIRVGNDVRLDFRLKVQGDVRAFSPDQLADDGAFHLHRRRVGVEGTLFERVTFQIERELRRGGPWRDVYANVEVAEAFEVRAGKFKMPFGLEQTTSTTDLDFVNRTLGSDALTPAREIGVMAHGRAGRLLEYEAGVFRNDGENARLREPVFLLPGEVLTERSRSLAARVVTTPWGRGGGTRPRVGVALTSSTIPDGLNSLRGRSVFDTVFAPRMYVRGTRTRTGLEGEWNPGALGFRGEYIRVVEERVGQGLGDANLSDYIGRSWYVSAGWVITGEEKAGGVRPRRSLFRDGFGAIEVATRFEALGFRSASDEGPAFTNPRADHVTGNEARVWTAGVNWYPNRWVRLQGNAVREAFEDAERTPVPRERTFWSGILRMQVVL